MERSLWFFLGRRHQFGLRRGALAQRFEVVPELLPFFPLRLRQLGEGVAADAGEIGVLLPVLHEPQHSRTELVGLFLQKLAPGGQVGAQPGQRLLTVAGTLLAVELGFVSKR